MADEAKRHAITGVEVREDGARIFSEGVSSQLGFFLRSVPVGWIACDDSVARWLENRQRELEATHKILAEATGFANNTERLAEILVEWYRERQQRSDGYERNANAFAYERNRYVEENERLKRELKEATNIAFERGKVVDELQAKLVASVPSDDVDAEVEKRHAALVEEVKRWRERHGLDVEEAAKERAEVMAADAYREIERLRTDLREAEEKGATLQVENETLAIERDEARRNYEKAKTKADRIEKERDRAMTSLKASSLMSWEARFESLVDAWAGSSDRAFFASCLVKTRAGRTVGAFLADLVKAATAPVSGLLALSG